MKSSLPRDLVPGRHWLVVAACLVISVLPQASRERLRGRVLDLTSRVQPGPAGAAASPEGTETARERELRNRVACLEAERADLTRALDEVGALGTLTAGRADLRLLTAEAFPMAGSAELVRRLVLGRGERDGVAPGLPVLAGEALVGIVGQTTRERCEVRLVTDPAFRLRASVKRLGIDGILSGTGGTTLVFVPAPSGEDEAPASSLVPGDALVVSRASTLCSVPAVVGYVREVKPSPGEGSSRAIVVPAASVARLSRVVVVRPDERVARRPADPEESR